MMNQYPQPLTTDESEFAQRHHNLVYRYLNQRHLPEDEYYDVVIFGYLLGVQKHFRYEELRKYSFTTLAWKSMDSCYINYVRQKYRPKRYASVTSLNDSKYGICLEETIPDSTDIVEEVIGLLMCQELLQPLNTQEQSIVELLMEGYPVSYISKSLGISRGDILEKIDLIQKQISADERQALVSPISDQEEIQWNVA